MFAPGKCPFCQKNVLSANVQEIPLNTDLLGQLKGISLSCPTCNSVLGVSFDPYALKKDLLNEIAAFLQKKV